MLNKKYEYRGFYKKYNMQGVIKIGTGTIKVHDIFEDIPEYMYKADCLFIDPPCSEGNMKSFYTKAEIQKEKNINEFNARLFDLIAEINPKHVFIETFKSNNETIFNRLLDIYGTNIKEFQTYYYANPKNKCSILYAYLKDENNFEIPFIDEEKAIEYICKNLEFNTIGDLCMGKGLVGFYANKHDKKFVGIELNEKRLACLLEHINKNKIIVR
jgi:hypothetical protein